MTLDFERREEKLEFEREGRKEGDEVLHWTLLAVVEGYLPIL